MGIDVDEAGNAHVVGKSDVTWGNPQLPYNAGGDVFVAVLNPSGTLHSNLFLGGSVDDYGLDIIAQVWKSWIVVARSKRWELGLFRYRLHGARLHCFGRCYHCQSRSRLQPLPASHHSEIGFHLRCSKDLKKQHSRQLVCLLCRILKRCGLN